MLRSSCSYCSSSNNNNGDDGSSALCTEQEEKKVSKKKRKKRARPRPLKTTTSGLDVYVNSHVVIITIILIVI